MSSSAITGPVLADTRRAPSGTAAAPSFAFNDSTGTGVYLVSAGVLGLSTAGVQRVVVDASGNVGIGTASPYTFSTYRSLDIRGTSGGWINLGTPSTSSFYMYSDGTNSSINTQTNGYLAFGTNNTERARLDSNGNLLVGTTANGAAGAKFCIYGTTGQEISINGVSGTCIKFTNSQNAGGSITIAAGGGTSYGTGSDYRLKEDVKPMTAALARVSALKPCTYKWKVDGSEGEGFIAHELQEVCPLAVSGEKDAVNEDGSIKIQNIDPSKLVGLLTAALQELSAKNDALEARLAALEGK